MRNIKWTEAKFIWIEVFREGSSLRFAVLPHTWSNTRPENVANTNSCHFVSMTKLLRTYTYSLASLSNRHCEDNCVLWFPKERYQIPLTSFSADAVALTGLTDDSSFTGFGGFSATFCKAEMTEAQWHRRLCVHSQCSLMLTGTRLHILDVNYS